MKPAPYEHHRPGDVETAVELLDRYDDAVPMAGNQSLGIELSRRRRRPDHVVDLEGLDELAYVSVTVDDRPADDAGDGPADGGSIASADENAAGAGSGRDDADADADVSAGGERRAESARIGARTRHRTVERSERLARWMPLVPAAAGGIAGPSVRNRGTLGGSLAYADPAANYPCALAALDATYRLRSVDGHRTVGAREFDGDLRSNELIVEAELDLSPFPPARTGTAFLKLKRGANAWPTVSAAAVVRVAGGSGANDGTAGSDREGSGADDRPGPLVETARLALANVDDGPLHVPDAEAAVEGTRLEESALSAVGRAVRSAADPPEDVQADPEYKREAGAEYARRALRTAYRRAVGD